MQHLEEGTIHAWLDGALSADETASVEQHVQQCQECAAMVAEARGMIAGAARIVSALDIVPGGVIPKQRGGATPSRSIWRSLHLSPLRAAMAASLMIVAASVVVARRADQNLMAPRAEMSQAVTTAAPTLPAPAPTASAGRMSFDSTAPVEARRMQPTLAKPSGSADVSRRTVDTVRQLSGTRSEEVAAKAEPPRSPPAPATAAPTAPPPAALAQDRKVLTGGSVGGVAADAANRVRADSSVAEARPRAASEIVAGRAVTPLQVLMTSSTETTNFIGCYQVERDPGVSTGKLPERFALERSRNMNVVRLVDSLNRADTTPIGTWREVDRTSVMVTLTIGGGQDSIRVSATADAAQAQRGQQGQQARMRAAFAERPIRIVRLNCSR